MASVGTKLVNDKLVFHYDMDNPQSFVGAPTVNYMNVWHPRRDASYTSYVYTATGEWANNHADAIYAYSEMTDGSITGFVNSGVTDYANTDHCHWMYDVELDEPVIVMRNYDGGVWKAFSSDHSLNLAALGLTTGDYYTYSYDLWTDNINYRPNPGMYTMNVTSSTAFWDGQGGTVTDNLPLAVGKWHRRWCSFQISANHDVNKAYTRFYWYGSAYVTNATLKIRRPQLELKTNVASAWTLEPRTNTTALLDLTKKHTINVANLVFANSQVFSFSGSTGANGIIVTMASDYTISSNSVPRTWEIVAYPTASIATAGLFGHVVSSGCSYFCNGGLAIYNSKWCFNWYDNTAYQFLDSGVTATQNQYAHVVGTYSSSDFKTRIYVNGVLKATFGSATNMSYSNYAYYLYMGFFSAVGSPFTGRIPVARYYYGKCLSDGEVANNFNALRARFGL